MNLTDDEIIKALECCQYEGVTTCRDCPIFYTHEFDNEIDFDCGKYIYGRALDLINRQQAEIERLNIELKAMRGAANSYKAEIERYKGVIKLLEIDVRSAKSEAIKEFAERLKECCYTYSDISGYQSTVIDVAQIDNLVQEMVGE